MRCTRERTAIALAVAHTLMMACYTLPSAWVPQRIRYWAQAYGRLFFHQDWRLFAPDPPACGCDLFGRSGPDGGEKALREAHEHFIWHRMVSNACRYTEATSVSGDATGPLPAVLLGSMERMVAACAMDGPVIMRLSPPCDTVIVVPILLSPER